MTINPNNPSALESLKSQRDDARTERDAARAELTSMTRARNEVQAVAASHREEIRRLEGKITEHEEAAAADWKAFNDAKADREEWRKGYHAAIAERDAARKKIEGLQAALVLGEKERNALEWLKQLMTADAQHPTPHNSVLIGLANRLLGNSVPPPPLHALRSHRDRSTRTRNHPRASPAAQPQREQGLESLLLTQRVAGPQ